HVRRRAVAQGAQEFATGGAFQRLPVDVITRFRLDPQIEPQQEDVGLQVEDVLPKGRLVPGRGEQAVAHGGLQDDAGDRVRDGGEVGRGPVDRDEKGRAEADVRVIRDDGQFLPRAGQEVQGPADRGPAVGLEDPAPGVGDVVAAYGGDDRPARVA